jgi:MFS family permease
LKADTELYVKRNFMWNFIANSMDNGFFMIAGSVISSATILPAFVRNLTPSNLIIGLISTIGIAAWSFPQLIAAHYTMRFPVKKDLIVVATALERCPWLLLGLFLLLLPSPGPETTLIVFFLVYVTTTLTSGLLTPAWLEMVAKVIPISRRGRFFGFSFFVGSMVGTLGGLVAGVLLESYGFPSGFAYCFLTAFALLVCSWMFLAVVREPSDLVPDERASLRQYLSQLPSILRSDRNFTLYLVSAIVLSIGGLGAPFYIVAAINALNPSGELIGSFTALLMGGQALTNIGWGYLGDRRGHKIVLQLGIATAILTTVLAAFASTASSYGLVFLLDGAALSAFYVSGQSIVLEFSSSERRPIYVGLSNTLRSPFQAMAPLLGGALADFVAFPAIFSLSAIIMAASLAILLAVREPRFTSSAVPKVGQA